MIINDNDAVCKVIEEYRHYHTVWIIVLKNAEKNVDNIQLQIWSQIFVYIPPLH